jgi:hypothetical protein
MAIRYFSEFKSDLDNEYKIEIHDSDFVGVVESFNVSGDGFSINYDGQTDNIVSPIIGSKCEISAYNNTSTFDNLITDLKLYQEKRFFVRIYKNTGSGNELFWTGVIMQDLIEIEDISKPYIFNIVATDGIGHLANKEYTGVVNTTINEFLKSAIEEIGMDDLYLSTDSYLATSVNVWQIKCIQPQPMC